MPIVSARRPVVMPDGHVEDSDSDFFYTWRADRPYMSPFLAAHKKPEVIFIPEYQAHRNTAVDVIGVTCVSNDPRTDADHFAFVAGANPPEASDRGVSLSLGRGHSIEFLTRDACTEAYGDAAPPVPEDIWGFAVGITISARSLEACDAALNLPHQIFGSGLIVPAGVARGLFLRFVSDQRAK